MVFFYRNKFFCFLIATHHHNHHVFRRRVKNSKIFEKIDFSASTSERNQHFEAL